MSENREENFNKSKKYSNKIHIIYSYTDSFCQLTIMAVTSCSHASSLFNEVVLKDLILIFGNLP